MLLKHLMWRPWCSLIASLSLLLTEHTHLLSHGLLYSPSFWNYSKSLISWSPQAPSLWNNSVVCFFNISFYRKVKKRFYRALKIWTISQDFIISDCQSARDTGSTESSFLLWGSPTFCVPPTLCSSGPPKWRHYYRPVWGRPELNNSKLW